MPPYAVCLIRIGNMPDNPRDSELDRRLEAWAASQADEALPSEVRRRIREELAPALTSVKPLPSPGRLALTFCAIFAAGAIVLTAVMDKAGFHLMTRTQMVLMAAILMSGGIVFSLAMAERMIPGSRQGFPAWLVLTFAGLAVLGGIAVLFPWRTSRAFVSEGWPCAATEVMLTVPSAVFFALVARRGALFGDASLGAVLGGWAVFLALLPLQFQCMFQQAPHLLVWHEGTAVILIGSSALLGAFLRGRWWS